MLEDDNKILDWMRLTRSQNIGASTFLALIDVYGSASNALQSISYITQKSRRKITVCSKEEAEKEIEKIYSLEATIIPSYSNKYPSILKTIKDYPSVLVAHGDISIFKKDSIAIVGSRDSSINGEKFTRNIAKDICQADLSVTSGLALGIDKAAHIGALQANGTTIAVIGCGIDKIYPYENTALFSEIKEKGLLLTEVPTGVSSKPQHFPQRNRIISGLSKGVLVVEATKSSGSIITARCALEHNRQVFSVPGFPLDPRHIGTNMLIKEGACLTESIDDILMEISPFSKDSNYDLFDVNKKTPENINNKPNNDLLHIKKNILSLVDSSPTGIDELIRRLGISTNLVTVALIELELENKLEVIAGNKVILNT